MQVGRDAAAHLTGHQRGGHPKNPPGVPVVWIATRVAPSGRRPVRTGSPSGMAGRPAFRPVGPARARSPGPVAERAPEEFRGALHRRPRHQRTGLGRGLAVMPPVQARSFAGSNMNAATSGRARWISTSGRMSIATPAAFPGSCRLRTPVHQVSQRNRPVREVRPKLARSGSEPGAGQDRPEPGRGAAIRQTVRWTERP